MNNINWGFHCNVKFILESSSCFNLRPTFCSINAGSWRDEMWPDKWTAVTVDGLLSAQFEHTLLVTEDGCDILTSRQEKNGQFHFMDKL